MSLPKRLPAGLDQPGGIPTATRERELELAERQLVPPLGRGPLVDVVERESFERSGRAVPVGEGPARMLDEPEDEEEEKQGDASGAGGTRREEREAVSGAVFANLIAAFIARKPPSPSSAGAVMW